jgi:hypothetical protein
MALGITDRVWLIGDPIEAALKTVPTKPTPTPAQRRKSFRVIQGTCSNEPHGRQPAVLLATWTTAW